MADTAVARQWDYSGQDLEDWYTRRYQEDPTFQPPRGYRIVNGVVKRESEHFFGRHPWLIPLLAAGGGLGAAALAGGLGAGAIGGSIGADVAGTAAATGAGGAAAGVGAGTGAATAATGGATASVLSTLARTSPAIAAALGYLSSRGGDSTNPQQQALMNELLQSQAARIRQQDPLYKATMSGIYQFLPAFAQHGGVNGIGLGGDGGDGGGTPDPQIPTIPAATPVPPGTGARRRRS